MSSEPAGGEPQKTRNLLIYVGGFEFPDLNAAAHRVLANGNIFSDLGFEVVFLAVSQVNGCHYCTAAHSMIADMVSGVPKDVLAAIRARQPIPDARLGALHALATDLVQHQGRPGADTVEKFLAAGFSERQMLYVVLAIAVKTLSNYTNHAFDTEVDVRFAKYAVS